MTCQLCGCVSHSAKTCCTLNNYPLAQGNNNEVCQYCKKNNHIVEKCFYIIGFPNQQQHHNPQIGTTMHVVVANVNNPPQYQLADTSAINHMTNEVHMLNNIAPYRTNDTVQVGNGKHLHITHIAMPYLAFSNCKCSSHT